MPIFLNRKLPRNEKGVIITEMVIVFPLLVFILWLIIEFGWYFVRQVQVDNVCRQSCRIGCRGMREVELREYIHGRMSIEDDQIVITVLDQDHIDIGDPDDRTFANYLVIEMTMPDVGLLILKNLDLHSRQEFLIEAGG